MSIFSKAVRVNTLVQPPPISTSILQLDNLLSGGIHPGQITEIYGPAGSGKTQLALTLALNTITSSNLHHHVVYISTEHAFPIKRLYQMIAHLPPTHSIDPTQISNNFHILDIPDAHRQYTLIKYHLAQHISKHPQTHLIIIDSISGHYRGLEKSALETSMEVHAMGMTLKKIASEFKCAMLVLNQITDVMREGLSGGEKFKGALGAGWEASVNTKVRVCRGGEVGGVQIRKLEVIYSPVCQEGTLEFDIDAAGVNVRDG